MTMIPDAPWIREAELRGTDYMGEFLGFEEGDDDDDYPYFDCDRDDLECGFDPYTGSYSFDC